MRLRILFGFVVSVLPAVCAAGTVTLFDGDFLDSNYDVSRTGTTHLGGGTASTFPVGGNPGSFRNVQHRANAGGFSSASRVWNINTMLTHDPSDVGAIESLDYSEDNLSLSGTTFSGAAAVRQDGFLYRSLATFVTTNSMSEWSPQELLGLTANDFELHFVDPNTGQFLIVPSAHPDFSEGGSEIEFGFWRQDGGNGFVRNGGLDNLRFTLTVAEIPEPSTIGLGLCALVFTALRRWQ